MYDVCKTFGMIIFGPVARSGTLRICAKVCFRKGYGFLGGDGAGGVERG